MMNYNRRRGSRNAEKRDALVSIMVYEEDAKENTCLGLAWSYGIPPCFARASVPDFLCINLSKDILT